LATLRSLRSTRRVTCVLRPGVGILIPMLLTTSTFRCSATDRISWKSEWAVLWYHQSWAAKHTYAGPLPPPSGPLGQRRMLTSARRAARWVAPPVLPRTTARGSSLSRTASHIRAAAAGPRSSRCIRTRLVMDSAHRYGEVDWSPPTCTADASGS
jgi:hypothetical protein